MGRDLIMGKGLTPCLGMIIGEAPGAEEEAQGAPFVGRSGRLLDEALEAVEFNRHNLYITNIYKLRPPNNRTPTDEEIDSHLEILADEFKEVQPAYVLLLGGTAIRVMTGLEGVLNNRGKWVDDGEFFFLPTVHPSYVLRGNAEAREWLFADVAEFIYKIRTHGKRREGNLTREDCRK